MGEVRPTAADPGLIKDLGHWLMQREEIGMVFADPDLVAGALPPSTVHQTHARSAPLSFVMRSDGSPGPGGIPGIGVYTEGVPLGGGMHGGLNPYEMNITLGFAIADGRKGELDDTPASLIDIAPTVLNLFGIRCDCDGRVLPLFEPDEEAWIPETLRAASGGFEQQLLRQGTAGRHYLIEGGRA